MITKEQAVEMGNKHYGEFHYGSCKKYTGPRGGVKLFIETWRVSGKCKTWKTMPHRFSLPIRHGYYDHGYLNENNCHQFHLQEECPLIDKHEIRDRIHQAGLDMLPNQEDT